MEVREYNLLDRAMEKKNLRLNYKSKETEFIDNIRKTIQSKLNQINGQNGFFVKNRNGKSVVAEIYHNNWYFGQVIFSRVNKEHISLYDFEIKFEKSWFIFYYKKFGFYIEGVSDTSFTDAMARFESEMSQVISQYI